MKYVHFAHWSDHGADRSETDRILCLQRFWLTFWRYAITVPQGRFACFFLILPGEFGKHLEKGNDRLLWNNFLLTENSRSDVLKATDNFYSCNNVCSWLKNEPFSMRTWICGIPKNSFNIKREAMTATLYWSYFARFITVFTRLVSAYPRFIQLLTLADFASEEVALCACAHSGYK